MGCMKWGWAAQSGAGQRKVGVGSARWGWVVQSVCRDWDRQDVETDNEAPFITCFEGGRPMDPMRVGFMVEGGMMPPPVALSWTLELGPVLLSIETVEPTFMRPVTEWGHVVAQWAW